MREIQPVGGDADAGDGAAEVAAPEHQALISTPAPSIRTPVLARQLGWPPVLMVQVGGADFPIVWSIVGDALLVAVLGLLSGRRARH